MNDGELIDEVGSGCGWLLFFVVIGVGACVALVLR